MIDLRRVDIQLLLLFMLLFPGISYIYIFHREYYLDFDTAKLLLSSIPIALPFIFLTYLLRLGDALWRITDVGISLKAMHEKVMRARNKLSKSEVSVASARLKTKITNTLKKIDYLYDEHGRLFKRVYSSAAEVEVPFSILLVFIAFSIIDLFWYFFHFSAGRYLLGVSIIIIGITLVSNILLPNLRDYPEIK